ncbi:MAG: ABC transporter ATP-binding protein [Sarcina sp.]
MNILKVNKINKTYKRKRVLENIEFSIKEGEIVGLIGPNGAGKTTIMKIITGLLKADSGSITIDGLALEKNRVEYLSKFSSIIETPSLYEILSGYDNINFIRKINNIPKEKMDSILKFININENIYMKVKNYSLGMKQRLALGIALLTESQLLILDEPTNGLDPKGIIEFRNLLESLVIERKISVLISSHMLAELDKICTKILFIKEGKLIDNIVDDTKKLQTVILTTTDSQKILDLVQTSSIINESYILNNTVNIQVESKNTADLMTILVKHRIEYSNIEIINNSIETIYKNIYSEDINEKSN